jgi:translation initiation factor 1A
MARNRRRSGNNTERKIRLPDPEEDEMLGLVTEIMGGGHMIVKGNDGTTYMGTIRGKIKKRMWVKLGDFVLIIPFDWETAVEGKLPKAYIIWRYIQPQVPQLQQRGLISEFLTPDTE